MKHDFLQKKKTSINFIRLKQILKHCIQPEVPVCGSWHIAILLRLESDRRNGRRATGLGGAWGVDVRSSHHQRFWAVFGSRMGVIIAFDSRVVGPSLRCPAPVLKTR